MKYFALISILLLLLSCSEKPTRNNPYDPNFDLPEPENVQIEHISLTSKKNTWDYEFDNFEGFKISRNHNGVWQDVVIVTADQKTCTEENVPVNENIQYKVIAFAGDNYSDDVLSVVIDNTIPAPTNFSLTQVNVHCYDLSWEQDHIVGEDGFIIERKIEDGEYIQIAETGENTDYYQDEWDDNRDENTVDYRIKTYVGEEYSSDVYIENEVFHEDDTPSNLQYEKLAINCIALSWEDNSEGEQGFKIDKKVGENEWVENYAFTIEDSTYWIDENAEINQDLQYRVYAYYEEMESASIQTDIIDNTFPMISGLAYEHINIYTIQLNWQDNSNGEQGFKIDKKVGSSNWESEYTIQGENTQTWIDENTEINQDIQYRVYAYYEEMESASIQTDIIDNNIPIPENLALEIVNANEIRLIWEYDLEGIEGFRIEKKAENESWELYADNIDPVLREWIDSEAENADSYRIIVFYQGYESDNSNEVIYIEGMIYVSGGTFEMGDHYGDGGDDELPVHEVTVNSFYICDHEVSQGEYEAVMGDNPAHYYGVGENYPVYYVSWYNAVTYCNELSIDKGLTPCYDLNNWSCDFNANGYRLPTEAEWEYAARGGVNWTDNYKYSGTTGDLDDYAWYNGNSTSQTHEVGTKLPNQLDIYDMSGNVREWCNDWYLSNYYESSPEDNPTGPNSGSGRVYRGGGRDINASGCRVADRYSDYPGGGNYGMGFRVARSLN